MPLYSAGLWLAVNIAPGSPSFPEAKYNISVDAKPIRITSIPCEVTPAENASARIGEEGRMSSPITMVPGSRSICKKRANATPVAKVKSASISTSTKPRMSYALKICANSCITYFLRWNCAKVSASTNLLLSGCAFNWCINFNFT